MLPLAIQLSTASLRPTLGFFTVSTSMLANIHAITLLSSGVPLL
jgi:hypothetical protein